MDRLNAILPAVAATDAQLLDHRASYRPYSAINCVPGWNSDLGPVVVKVHAFLFAKAKK